MIPSRTVSANCPALPRVMWPKYCSFSFATLHINSLSRPNSVNIESFVRCSWHEMLSIFLQHHISKTTNISKTKHIIKLESGLGHPARKQIAPILQLPRPAHGSFFLQTHTNDPLTTCCEDFHSFIHTILTRNLAIANRSRASAAHTIGRGHP